MSEEGKLRKQRSDHVDIGEQFRQEILQFLQLLVFVGVADRGHHHPKRVEDVDAERVGHFDYSSAFLSVDLESDNL